VDSAAAANGDGATTVTPHRSVPAVNAQSWLATAAAALALPTLAALLGWGAIRVAEAGVSDRPAFAAAVIAAGAIAGLLPLRYGLAVAVVLSTFGGFFIDFVGDRALYWNEALVAVVVARSVVARRPSRRELVLVGLIAGIFGAYAISGVDGANVLWGAKVLLTSVALAWAIGRLDLGWREWRGLYYGLAIAAGANIVLAAWQRAQGIEKLLNLGLPYEERIRETGGGGTLRAFGGFTSPAPFSYMLAIAFCAWAAFALSHGHERRLAIATFWMPAAAGLGIVLAVDRTTPAALLVAGLILALTFRRKVLLPLVGVATGVVIALFAAGVVSSEKFGNAGSAGHARLALWGEYLDDFRLFGEGPASAGSAYAHVKPRWVRPFQVPNSWHVTFARVDIVGTNSGGYVQTRFFRRPPLKIAAVMQSVTAPMRLTVELETKGDAPRITLLDFKVPLRPQQVEFKIPQDESSRATLWFTVSPWDATAHQPIAAPTVEARGLRVVGLPKPRTPAERIWDRWFARTPAALQSDGPGLVDNLYVSWIFQYGIIGVVLCGLWLAVLAVPTLKRKERSSMTAAALVGIFLIVAAATVNVWEEAPTDLLAALVFGIAFAEERRRRVARAAEVPLKLISD
jgi:hypothetical protein